MATPISQQFSLPLHCVNENGGGAAQDLFTLTLTDGTTVQLRVQEEGSKPVEIVENENMISIQNSIQPHASTINPSPCPPMVPLDPTVSQTTALYPSNPQVVFNHYQSSLENTEMIEVRPSGNTITQSEIKNSVMGAEREAVTIQEVDLSSPIHQKHDEVQVEDFDDILKNIMESADNSCSSDSFSSSKEISCSKTRNCLPNSVNITKDVTLQLAAPVTTGEDDDVSKLNSLQTTLSSMSSYLSHLKTGLKGYDLQEPPTDAHLAFDSLTSSNFPDLLNYNNVVEKGVYESSKNGSKRTTRAAGSTSKPSKHRISRLNDEKIDDFDLDQDASDEMDGLDNKLETDNSDFIDDELLSMFTSVHNTTIESLKARLMASRLPDGSTETDLGTLLVAAKIDLTVDEIVTPPLNAVKKLMDSHTLTDWQQTLCLKIRRRKKNTVSEIFYNFFCNL